MVFVLNRALIPLLVAKLTIDVSEIHFSLFFVVNLKGHWCGRELAAMILHSSGCGRWKGPNMGGAYEEARQV